MAAFDQNLARRFISSAYCSVLMEILKDEVFLQTGVVRYVTNLFAKNKGRSKQARQRYLRIRQGEEEARIMFKLDLDPWTLYLSCRCTVRQCQIIYEW